MYINSESETPSPSIIHFSFIQFSAHDFFDVPPSRKSPNSVHLKACLNQILFYTMAYLSTTSGSPHMPHFTSYTK